MTRIVLGFDGLEDGLVEEFRLDHLKQEAHAELNLSDFPIISTPPIWAAMITGEINEEMIGHWIPDYQNVSSFYSPAIKLARKILPQQVRRFLNLQLKAIYDSRNRSPLHETFSFLEDTNTPTIFDELDSWHNEIPGYNAKEWKKKKVRFKKGFKDASDEAERKGTMELIEREHQRQVEMLRKAIGEKDDYELVFWYTMYLDEIGHLDRGSKIGTMNRYMRINDLVGEIRSRLEREDKLYVISDHGMRPVGRFGLHDQDAFFSSSDGNLIEKPAELYNLLKSG